MFHSKFIKFNQKIVFKYWYNFLFLKKEGLKIVYRNSYLTCPIKTNNIKTLKINYYLIFFFKTNLLRKKLDKNQLNINLFNKIKVNYFDFLKKKGWITSLGVILKLLKLVEKREKKLEKNKIFFINYLLKFFFKKVKINYCVIKHYNTSVVFFLKKVNFFKKVHPNNIILFVNYNYSFFKKIRRIKRRLKKRIFKYEMLTI
jgi:hypothetical protein